MASIRTTYACGHTESINDTASTRPTGIWSQLKRFAGKKNQTSKSACWACTHKPNRPRAAPPAKGLKETLAVIAHSQNEYSVSALKRVQQRSSIVAKLTSPKMIEEANATHLREAAQAAAELAEVDAYWQREHQRHIGGLEWILGNTPSSPRYGPNKRCLLCTEVWKATVQPEYKPNMTIYDQIPYPLPERFNPQRRSTEDPWSTEIDSGQPLSLVAQRKQPEVQQPRPKRIHTLANSDPHDIFDIPRPSQALQDRLAQRFQNRSPLTTPRKKSPLSVISEGSEESETKIRPEEPLLPSRGRFYEPTEPPIRRPLTPPDNGGPADFPFAGNHFWRAKPQSIQERRMLDQLKEDLELPPWATEKEIRFKATHPHRSLQNPKNADIAYRDRRLQWGVDVEQRLLRGQAEEAVHAAGIPLPDEEGSSETQIPRPETPVMRLRGGHFEGEGEGEFDTSSEEDEEEFWKDETSPPSSQNGSEQEAQESFVFQGNIVQIDDQNASPPSSQFSSDSEQETHLLDPQSPEGKNVLSAMRQYLDLPSTATPGDILHASGPRLLATLLSDRIWTPRNFGPEVPMRATASAVEQREAFVASVNSIAWSDEDDEDRPARRPWRLPSAREMSDESWPRLRLVTTFPSLRERERFEGTRGPSRLRTEILLGERTFLSWLLGFGP